MFGLAHGGDRVVSQRQVIMAKFTTGGASSSLVINEGADTCRGKQALQGEGSPSLKCRTAVRSMHQNNDRHWVLAFGHDQPAGECYTGSLKTGLENVEGNKVAFDPVEEDPPCCAVAERDTFAVGPSSHTPSARPTTICSRCQFADHAVLHVPNQVFLIWPDVDVAPVREAVGADVAVVSGSHASLSLSVNRRHLLCHCSLQRE